MERIEALQETLPYVREFQGKTFVIKLGGEVCRNSNLDNVAKQLSLIHHIGIRAVVVHGGGPQMGELSARLGLKQQIVQGRRITDAQTLEAAKMVYAGTISTDIAAALRKHGAGGVGLSGVDSFLIEAKRRPEVKVKIDTGDPRPVDYGFVGDIEKINPEIIKVCHGAGLIPVISSLGGNGHGSVYNINADSIASALSQSLKADKLIVLTNVAGILAAPEEPSSLISYIDVEGLEGMIKEKKIRGGMLPKAETCIEAVKGGVHRTHILDGTKKGSILLELFSNQGCGTMIVSKAERLRYEDEKTV